MLHVAVLYRNFMHACTAQKCVRFVFKLILLNTYVFDLKVINIDALRDKMFDMNIVVHVHVYLQVVREGELKIIPEMHKKTWYNWLENNRY